MSERSIALVGVGGFGVFYVKGMYAPGVDQKFTLKAGIDPMARQSPMFGELQKRNVRIYPSLDDFLRQDRAELVILCSPLQLHCEQVCQALGAGCNVLCEKPLGASVAQIRQMQEARDKAGKIVAIGYQWSFAPPIQRLKRDIMSGRLGAPRRMATIILWPRDERYFTRNSWAGRITDDSGRPVLDSPANNACAHYLHNMLYLLGKTLDTSAQPHTVSAELYRANPIENYDTSAIRCTTDGGADLLFLASHVTSERQEPIFRYEFESATVTCTGENEPHIKALFADGHEEDYGALPTSLLMDKVWLTLDNIENHTPTVCGIEAAGAHTRCICAAQGSPITTFAERITQRVPADGSHRFVVDGLGSTLMRCYQEFRMPADLGAAWATRSKPVRA